MRHVVLGKLRNRVQLAALALALCALGSSAAHAQIADESWSLKISEKEKAITDPTNSPLQNFLMQDLGSDRVMNRNMPYMELTNFASDLPITEFRITIGDERFHFDCGMLNECAMVSSAPAGVNVTKSVIPGTGDNGPLEGGELVLNFGNGGLAQGESVRFKIALGVDDAYEFFHRPDFRTVLFDMNRINVYDGNLHLPSSVDPTLDNAKVTIKFGSGANSQTVGPVAVEDYDVQGEAAKYFNDHFRRYGVMESVDTFLLLGAIGTEIPEPSTALLAMVALIGGLSVASRSRRRAARAY